MSISDRKDEHIKFGFQTKIQQNKFDTINIEHQSISKFDLEDVSLETNFLGYNIPYPIYINAMTGGSEKAMEINTKLAYYSKAFSIPLVLGSQSAALKDDSLAYTYNITRKINPTGIIISNISPNYGIKDASKAVNMVNANGLSIHLNIIQELVMKEGDRKFSHWNKNISEIVKNAKYPVLVKEVGFGMSRNTLETLKSLGVKHIDVSGKGGTNFAKIERLRNEDSDILYDDIGIQTVDSLLNAKGLDLYIYASGGIRDANDIFKALYLGANAVGLSNYFLQLTKLRNDEAIEEIEKLLIDLKKLFLIYGYKNIDDLRK